MEIPAMDLQNFHELLVQGADFAACRHRVHRFFANNILVRYDSVQVIENESLNGADPEFWKRIAGAEEANRRMVDHLLQELQKEGYEKTADFLTMGQGYLSKTFHIAAHLLDGFFGIDSALYNLEDDSHWLPDSRRRQISAAPGSYWLIKVSARSRDGKADQLSTLRSIAKTDSDE
jgi:hypothetical protein